MVKQILRKLYRVGLFPRTFLEEPFFFLAQRKKIASLKNMFSGQRVFIIGNGPSLNNIDLDKLSNEHSMGVNSIFLKTESGGFCPSIYMVEDGHVFNDNKAAINNYEVSMKFFPSRYRFALSRNTKNYFFNMNRGFYENLSPNFGSPRFSIDFSRVGYCGQSVTILNLQLAFYLGFSEVYLIGMDFDYKIPKSAERSGDTLLSTEDDENHFDPRYFGKGKKWHDPKLENVLVSYKNCKAVYELHNRKIFNATIGGKLEVFDRVNFDEIF